MKIATARQRIAPMRRAAKSGDDETAHRLAVTLGLVYAVAAQLR